jgi:hypothetical protein
VEAVESLRADHNPCFCRRCSRRRSFRTVGNGSAPSPESNVGTGRGSSSVGAGAGVPARLELVSDGDGSVENGGSEVGPGCSVGSGTASKEEEEEVELEGACSNVVVVVVNVGPASTVDVVDTEPSPPPRSVEGAAGGVVGAVSDLELVDELELVSIEDGNAVLGSSGKVELASDVWVGNSLLVGVGGPLFSFVVVEEELVGCSPPAEVEVADTSLEEVRVGRSGRPGGLRSEVAVEVVSGNDVSKEVVGQPPRQTGMPGMQDSLLLVGSAVGRSCVRVVVVALWLPEYQPSVRQGTRKFCSPESLLRRGRRLSRGPCGEIRSTRRCAIRSLCRA